MNRPTTDLSSFILKRREKIGLSQRQLAELSGLSNTEISRIEKGSRKHPSPETLKAIAPHIQVNYELLLELAGYLEKRFYGNQLKKLRGTRTYEEYGQTLGINPIILERYEKELEKPLSSVILFIADMEGVLPDYFYTENAEIEEMRQQESINRNFSLSFLPDDIRKWASDPENKEYIEFAYSLYKSGISKDGLKLFWNR